MDVRNAFQLQYFLQPLRSERILIHSASSHVRTHVDHMMRSMESFGREDLGWNSVPVKVPVESQRRNSALPASNAIVLVLLLSVPCSVRNSTNANR